MSKDIPQFKMPPAPPDSYFENPEWVERLVELGMPRKYAEIHAVKAARQAYLMPHDIQECYLKSLCEIVGQREE